mmetsp:Transcript_6261/g.11406  ORF Transcript_6261/g.11406 Transcript_6261/m.11406 type:complete len:542 (+) Transcript_6261:146-1771(+)
MTPQVQETKMSTTPLVNSLSRAPVVETRDCEMNQSRASADKRDKAQEANCNHECETNHVFPPYFCVPSNPPSIIQTIESTEENVCDPPPRPAEAFLDLECWFEHGCKPYNPEYMDWLRKCIDSEYAYFCLLECWQGRGRFQQDKWKVANIVNGRHTVDVLDEQEFEEARDRACSMLHVWLQEEENNHDCTLSWQAMEMALPLFRKCLEETKKLDRLRPHLDVSREKVATCRKEVWAAYEEESREVKDLVGDELLLMLIVYELLQDLKRDTEDDDSEIEFESSADDSSIMHNTASDEETFHDNTVLVLPHFESSDSPNLVNDDSEKAMSSTDDSYCVSAISTRVPCQGRGSRSKAIILMDILLSNTISEQWEPDLDVDLLKMAIKALGADSHPMNRKVVLPAILKVLSYWACRPGDFDEDHWEIFRLEILPALQASQKKCPKDPLSGGVSQEQERPKKRTRRATRAFSQGPNDPNHCRHLRSEATAALLKLKECALSFPVVSPNDVGASRDLTNCIETLTWMLDEKCIAWMMDSEWRPERTV